MLFAVDAIGRRIASAGIVAARVSPKTCAVLMLDVNITSRRVLHAAVNAARSDRVRLFVNVFRLRIHFFGLGFGLWRGRFGNRCVL